MTKNVLVAGLLLTSTAVCAQQSSPLEQALSVKLSAEINAGLQCSAAIVTMQQDLAKVQARIKELEEKHEPKKSEK